MLQSVLNPGRNFSAVTSSLSPRPFRALTGSTKREVRVKLISAKRAKHSGTKNNIENIKKERVLGHCFVLAREMLLRNT
jgi:hypothetical protein